jgi:hypothetical protein
MTYLQDIVEALAIGEMCCRDLVKMLEVCPSREASHAEQKSTEKWMKDRLYSLLSERALLLQFFEFLEKKRPQMMTPFAEIVRMKCVVRVRGIWIREPETPQKMLL